MDFGRVFKEALPILLNGLGVTVGIALISIFAGMILGLISCLFGMSKVKVLKGISAVYIWIIRGTPMIVQAFLVFFAIPQLIQLINPSFRLEAFTAGCITLSLNAGAYMSEIFRAGIQAIDKGQMEAARSLGLSKGQAMRKIILPQAFKISIPPMVNQFIITVKDTSILSVIGLAEIVNRAKQYVGKTYQFFATYILVAVFYLIVISVLMVISKFVEKKFSYESQGKNRRA
ncbi:MAG: amino acid ABC transporter permease [Ruminococcaceae bacterium]|nr:amino acid ABC transporter permease [Oscillospiraceae bacterium]